MSASATDRAQAYGTGEAGGDARAYDGDYVLLPDDAPFRPERRTPRPVIRGPQTAVVVGEGEIDCDEYGRILVRYHWDLEAAHSMRCRVSQNWASKGWGGMVIPRIGMEVIVEHLEGDPDKPIVTGCVYNGANMPPYELPRHKTRSTFRSDTHKGQGFNELRFEDEKGREEVFLHTEKDQVLFVKNHRVKQVLGSQVESVQGNKQIEIARNHSETVDGNMDIKVGIGFAKALNAGVAALLGRSTDRLSKVLKSKVYRISQIINPINGLGNFSLQVSGSKVEYIAMLSTENIGQAKSSIVMGERIEVTGGTQRTKVAGNVINQIGKFETTDAAGGWQLTTGSSSIICLADGTIRISGKNVSINGEESVKITGGRIDLN